MNSLRVAILTSTIFVVSMGACEAEDAKPKTGHHVFVASVIEVIDGDSIVVKYRDEPITIRIEGIDAPELTQAYGKEAQRALAAALPIGSTVVIEELMRGKYGRIIGHVHRRELSQDPIGLAMLKSGDAWHFDRYNNSPDLRQAQIEARAAKRGLWRVANSQSPFAYRVAHDAGEVRDPMAVHKPSEKYEHDRRQPLSFWLNNRSDQRHLVGCAFADHEHGRPCQQNVGKPCGVCLESD